jgi:tetrahydromethanopterin S-methyltransferase subunit F
MAVLFDTRAYHRTLTDAGVPPEQADAHMRALGAALEGGVATKQDLSEVRQELKQEIATVRQEVALLRKDVELMGRELKIGTGGVVAAATGIVVGAVKLL